MLIQKVLVVRLQRLVRQIERHKIVERHFENFLKLLGYLRLVEISVGVLTDSVQRRQQREEGTFPAVISPHRNQNVFHAMLANAFHCRTHGFHRKTVMRREPVPRPSPARKPSRLADFFMRREVAIVIGFFRMVIIPIHELHPVRHGIDYLLRHFERFAYVIIPAVGKAEEHIAPHMRFESVFFGNRKHFLQMPRQKLETVLITVLVEVSSEPDHMRLVHTDIHKPRGEILRNALEHFFYERIRFFLVNKQNIRRIANGRISGVLENPFKVRKRLYAGNKLHPLFLRIDVDFTDFRARVSAAHIPKVRLVLYFIRILRIQFKRVVTELDELVYHFLNLRHFKHRVPRAIKHNAKTFILHISTSLFSYLLLYHNIPFCQGYSDINFFKKTKNFSQTVDERRNLWYNKIMIAKRVIAFDIGDKRIGVAVSDPFNEYAMPCETYFRTRSFETDAHAIAKIAADKGVGVIVCGLPVFTDGTESEQTEKTRRFIAALEKATELPIVIEDERFTTAEAKETQMLGGVKQSRRKQTVDSIAASFILESYLKKQKNHEKEKLMKEQISTEEYEDELERIIELEDEDGNVEKYLHIGTIEYRSEWYCFFQKAEPETEEEEDEVVMFRLVGEGDDKRLETLDDEQLMDEVFAEFCHQYEDFENSEEAMQLE